MTWEIREGDALARLAEMPDESVQCCVTSPPYFGLRDYGTGEWEGGDVSCDHVAPPRSSTVDGMAALAAKNRGGGHKLVEAAMMQFRDVCGSFALYPCGGFCGTRRQRAS